MMSPEVVDRFEVHVLGDRKIGNSILSAPTFTPGTLFTNFISLITPEGSELIIPDLADDLVILKIQDPEKVPFNQGNYTYHPESRGVVICFDLTSHYSFANALAILDSFNEHTNIMLIGCKSDLYAQQVVNENEIQSAIFGKKIPYFETSPNSDMGKIFEGFAKRIYIKRENIKANLHVLSRKSFDEYVALSLLKQGAKAYSPKSSNTKSSLSGKLTTDESLQKAYRDNLKNNFDPAGITKLDLDIGKMAAFIIETLRIIDEAEALHAENNPWGKIVVQSPLSRALKEALTELSNASYTIKKLLEKVTASPRKKAALVQ